MAASPTRSNRFGLPAAALVAFVAVPIAEACTRAVYLGPSGQTVTGRTMDWAEDMGSNLWIFPRGLARDGACGANSLKWTSRFGSVVTSVYEAGTADGMNEKGLVGNLLYLVESEYPPSSDPRPGVAISAWCQYVLDNFATAADAVAELQKESFKVLPATAPNGKAGTVHLAISDPTGDSAIFEYIGGKLVIHHNRKFQVLTNSPTYDQQLALNRYWERLGGTVMLPGTNRAADRFARASFYINACQQSAVPREAVAAVFSVMNNVSVPRGITTPDQPNIASTLWRTVSDQRNRVYFFDGTSRPSLLWVQLDKIDFRPEAGTRKLTIAEVADLGGDQTSHFKPAAPFRFLSPSS